MATFFEKPIKLSAHADDVTAIVCDKIYVFCLGQSLMAFKKALSANELEKGDAMVWR